MFAFFRAITARLKALFFTNVGLDLKAQFLTRDAERQAELLRQANRYEAEGLHGIAQHLRQRAERLSLERALASVLPALSHLQDDPPAIEEPTLLADANQTGVSESAQRARQLSNARKKGG